MRWANTETPTFAGSDGTAITGPDVVETFQLLDRDGNVVATFTKSVAGVYSLNVAGAVSQSDVSLVNTVIGDASGYKIARSAAPVALDGSNPTSVAHGLTTCVAVCVQLVGSAAPADSTSVLTAVINGANIDVYAWKHTTGGAAGNPTLIASTGTETFNWLAIGT